MPSVQNWVNMEPFFFCTECRKEVTAETPPKTVWTTYPVIPTPISVEEVITLEDFEQLELFDNPWFDHKPVTTIKDNQDNG